MAEVRTRTRQKNQYSGANHAPPLPIPPGPHRRAGRKRGISRGMRRFESAVGRMDLPNRLTNGKQLITHLRAGAWHLSKLASALLLAGVITALYSIHTQDEWFVYAEDIRFENTAYLDAPELYARLEIEGWNIFWLRPQTVQAQILSHAGVTDAQVRLGLPGQIEITVTERQPVALWVTNRGIYRVAENGIALSRALTPAEIESSPADLRLPQIVDPLQEAQRPGVTDAPTIDDLVLSGALDLIHALPELGNRVRFNRDVGFNFAMPDGSGWVYWGDGLHPEEKRTNLDAARQYMTANAIENRIVDVRFINRPYLR